MSDTKRVRYIERKKFECFITDKAGQRIAEFSVLATDIDSAIEIAFPLAMELVNGDFRSAKGLAVVVLDDEGNVFEGRYRGIASSCTPING